MRIAESATECDTSQDANTAWTFSDTGASCDPDGTDGSISADYGFTSLEALEDPDLVTGVLHYRFRIPQPALNAMMSVQFSYQTSNAIIGVFATTGAGADLGPPAGGVIVAAEPQVVLAPTGLVQPDARRGTTRMDLPLFPAGAEFGDL